MRLKPLATLSLVSISTLAAAGVGCDSPGTKMVDAQRLELHDTRSETVTENQVPPSVMQTFRDQSPKAKIVRIEKRYYVDGEPFFRIHYAIENGEGMTRDFNP